MFAKKFRLKHSLIFVLSIVFSIFVYGCSSSSSSSGGGGTPPVDVKSISITNAPEYLNHGEEYQLEIDVPGLSVNWETSYINLLEIDNNGLLRAGDAGEGMSVITASYGDIKDAVSIYVKAPDTQFVSVSSINIGVEELKFDMLAGEQLHLTSEILPVEATNKTVIWKVNDTSLATIDENGVLTANGENKSGIVTVTAKAGLQTDSVEVTINSRDQVIPVQEIKITGSAEIFIGHEPVQFVAEVIPSDATFNKVTWKSSNELVAVVDDTGKVSASDNPDSYPGTAVITATAGGVTSSYEVTVKEVPVEQVRITGHENYTVNGKTTLRFYDILQLQAVVTPADTSCENILWSSSDENVSPGDANGRVEIRDWAGSVTITATAVDKLNQPCGDNASASIDVEFIQMSTEVPISEMKIVGYDEMAVGGKATFKVEFFPVNATDNQIISWSTNNSAAVSIEYGSNKDNAVVKALKDAENVVITAKTLGGRTAEYTIKKIKTVQYGYEKDADGVYLIYNKEGFSNSFYDIENKSFKLMTDLDFTDDSLKRSGELFRGTFDGNGHTIKAYKINETPSSGSYGFVSSLEGGTIMNVTFDTPSLMLAAVTNLDSSSGIVAGINNGTIKNVVIKGAVVELGSPYTDLFFNAGIIAGKSNGLIDNCTINSGSITMTDNGSYRTIAGGITGTNTGKIISSGASDINITNNAPRVDYTTGTGGIAGLLASGSYVKGSHAAGQIKANDYAGGIAGVIEQGAAEVSASIFVGAVNSTGANTGLDYGSYTALTNEGEVYVKNISEDSTLKIKSPVTTEIKDDGGIQKPLADALYSMNKILKKDAEIQYLFKAGDNRYREVEFMLKALN